MAGAGVRGSELLARAKLEDAEGCFEDPDVAFQLFAGTHPKIFGTFGFHAIPHLGNYDHDDCAPTLPIGLLSFPLTDLEAQLPPSVTEMLQLCIDRGVAAKDKIDLYVVLHSQLEGPAKGIECGHFNCHNTDEMNLLYHAWLFQDDNVADGADEISAKIHTGVFEPHGVKEVHVGYGGTPFGYLSVRPVVLHDRRFSPNNAHIQLDGRTDTPVFFSVGVDRVLRKAIVALHVLPVGEAAADRVRAWIRGRRTLCELLAGLRENVPVAHAHVARMVRPLVAADLGPRIEEIAELQPAKPEAAAVAAGGSGVVGGATA